jgi:murein DD-endopeptidase MepM/ murein hydrolase activator NlpD
MSFIKKTLLMALATISYAQIASSALPTSDVSETSGNSASIDGQSNSQNNWLTAWTNITFPRFEIEDSENDLHNDQSRLQEEDTETDEYENEDVSPFLIPNQSYEGDLRTSEVLIPEGTRFKILEGAYNETGTALVKIQLESGLTFWTTYSDILTADVASDYQEARRGGRSGGRRSGTVTSGYGWRRHPVTGRRAFHYGIDIAYPHGTPVANRGGAGQVAYAGWYRNYGNIVVIHHSSGKETRYAHLSSIAVRVGQSVDSSANLGRVGCTGRCTGPHLHFENHRIGSRGHLSAARGGRASQTRSSGRRRR